MNNDLKLEIVLPKIPEIEILAIQGLEKMGKFYGISDDKINEAKLIVTEAVINGLEHAGEENPYVNVEFSMTKEKLNILVTDFGKGFDPGSVKDPDIKDKIFSDNKRGWGMKLMKSFSDNLIIESSPTGTKISVLKKLI